MEREIDLSEVSDGKLYTSGDLVRIGCNDCTGCSECCRVVEDTILLDPYDIYQLERRLGVGFEALMDETVRLTVVDGVIQPHLYVRPEGEGCIFLGKDGRCTIHDSRPGFCRMFPMGRIYEDGDFRYFLQVRECAYPNKTKVKLKKWLGIPELGRYEQFVKDWHFFLKRVQRTVEEAENDTVIKRVNLFVLNQFYVKPYDTKEETGPGFYEPFYERLEAAEATI